MTIAHEALFVDANFSAGQLAGEAVSTNVAPTAEAIGVTAVPQALYFAARDERSPSQIAKAQLDAEGPGQSTAWTETTAQTVAQRRQEAEERAANRTAQERQ
jgi:hypothetical protein